MKKLLILCLLPSILLAGDQDFVKGIDFIGRTNANQSTLNQLVDSATVATNKGLIIWTNDAPSVTANPKLKRYVWMDTAYNPPQLKVYNTNTATWESASLSDGSVTTAKIATSAVTESKIAKSAVTVNKLASDSVTSSKIVDGTIVSDDLSDNSIGRGKLIAGAVDGTIITNNAIANSHLQAGVIEYSNLASGLVLSNNNIPTLYPTNYVLGYVYNSNMTVSAITDTNITNSTITFAKLNTNITYMLPRYLLYINSAGSIVNQVSAPGLTACTASRTSAGVYLITFGTAMSATNSYFVNVSPLVVSGVGGGFSTLTNNTTTTIGYKTYNTAGTADDLSAHVTIYGY